VAVLAAVLLIQDRREEDRRVADSASSKASFASGSPRLKN
jgi:hypothetical protein